MAVNRVNITLGDMQLIQVDMLAKLNGMNRSEFIARLINTEFAVEELNGRLDYKTLHKQLDERIAQRWAEKGAHK